MASKPYYCADVWLLHRDQPRAPTTSLWNALKENSAHQDDWDPWRRGITHTHTHTATSCKYIVIQHVSTCQTIFPSFHANTLTHTTKVYSQQQCIFTLTISLYTGKTQCVYGSNIFNIQQSQHALMTANS